MSLKPLALGLLVSIVLSGGLAVAAHAAGQVVEGGAEVLAALLVGSRSGVTPKQHDATASTSPTASRSTAPVGSASYSRQGVPSSMRRPGDVRGSAQSPPRLARFTPPRTIRLRTDAPTCDDVYVYIVSIFENVGDSVATLALDASGRGRPRRVGQRVGRYEVIGIGYNASRVSSAVWLAEGSRVCQALVRDANPVREKQQLRQLARAKQVSVAARKARLKQAKQRRAKRSR